MDALRLHSWAMHENNLNIACPQCGKKTVYRESNPDRPFCSERCRMIDLGAWLEEEYKVAGQPAADEETPSTDEGSG